MKNKVVCLVLLIALAATFAVDKAYAHEGREVGNYTIEIGWRVEPAYTGLMNGPEITVTRHEESETDDHDDEATPQATGEHSNEGADDHENAANGVVGLESTLQIEVAFGPSTRVLTLRPVSDQPGHYTADLIPTRPGDYIFRVFGKIEDLEVDEKFSAAEGQFSTVDPIEDIQFPQ